MDFVELESMEGLRWPWNAWPSSRSEASALVVPLSVIWNPLMQFPDLPFLSYDPLVCTRCRAVLNPYARVDYQSGLWICPFCSLKNSFPRSYAGIGEHNLPAELFPTYSTVEYQLGLRSGGISSSSSSSLLTTSSASLGSSISSASLSAGLDSHGPAFVFVVDTCMDEAELQAVKGELLHIVAQLPEDALVGLVSFGAMVMVHDLGFGECSRVVLLHGERELSSAQVISI
ncbi:hypothetical protein ACLOJK_032837 [Asimina triloba]